MRTDWLNYELAYEATRLPVVAVPLPPLAPFATPFSSGATELEPEAEEPPAIQALGGYVKRSPWRTIPEAQVQEWLDAAAAYLERQHSILTELRTRSDHIATLDPGNPLHAKRIAEEAVPPQRAALTRLLEAGEAYEPTLRAVQNCLPMTSQFDPWIDPVHPLRAWFKRKDWVVLLEGTAGRIMHVDLIADKERTWIDEKTAYEIGEADFWAVSLHTIQRATTTAGTDQVKFEVEWDPASLAYADRAVAELWNGIDAEHDLPGDFAAACMKLYGITRLPRRLFGVTRDFRVRPKWVREREAMERRLPMPPAGEWSGGG